MERTQGETTLLVASNAAFNISSIGMVGNVTVTVEKTGDIGGTTFGASAQLPGQRTQSTFLTTAFETSIYQADEKTAYRQGSPIDQAVLIRISYSGVVHPEIKVETAL